MTTYFRLPVALLLSAFLLAGAHAQAALPWPETAVKNLQTYLKKGLCPAPATERLAQDVCAAHGLAAKTKPARLTLSKPKPSLLLLESAGRVIKIERGDDAREFVVNRVKIDAGAARTQAELKALIEPALRSASARFHPLLETAHAAPLDPAIPALIQQLIAETHQLGNCGFYLEFGRKCTDGMKKVLAEIDVKKSENEAAAKDPNGFMQMHGRASYLTQVTHLNGHLNELHDRLEKTVFPSLEGYDTVRMCAARATPGNIDKTQADAERALKDCRESVRRMAEATGGAREVRETEGLLSQMWGRLTGRPVAKTAPSAAGGTAADGDARR